MLVSGYSSSSKRVASNGSSMPDEDEEDAHFFLRAQNKSLAVELMSSKRQIAESRKELDLLRNRSREMESLVSVIQRSWSQVGTLRLSRLWSSFLLCTTAI